MPSAPGRKAYTCTPCRLKKVKCDRQRVCGRCSRKRIPCIWPANGLPLERVLPDSGTSRHTLASPETSGSPLRSPRVSSPQCSERPSPRSQSAAPHRISIPRNVALAEQLDHSILNDAATPSPVSQYPEEHMSSGDRFGSFPFASAWDSRSRGFVTERLLNAIPSRVRADIMLRTYLDRVEWIHHPLHVPTFLSQYNRFWTMSPTMRCDKVHSRWLALLYIILCLGVHFGDDDPSPSYQTEISLRTASEECLSAADFLNQPCQETIQTIICLNLYLNNSDQVSAARGLLALAIRMAQNMGLSRIPPESESLDQKGVVEREMGRRLWWSLVCQDAYTASNSGFTYSINLHHSTTGLFANIDDDQLEFPLRSQPWDDFSASTYHLAKIDFALVVRDFIDAINANFPDAAYEDILELDARFRMVYEKLPASLRPDLPHPFEYTPTGSKRHLVEQRIFMGVTLHNRILRLHRAYMSRGYDDERYSYSTRACLDSAYALLDLVLQFKQMLCRWWVVLVHVWTCGLVISVDMFKNSSNGTEKQRAGIELAISLLEPASRNSPVALRGIKVLRSLLVPTSASTRAIASQTHGDGDAFVSAAVGIASHEASGASNQTQDPAAFLQSLFQMDFSQFAASEYNLNSSLADFDFS